jgi:lipopolysaccharide/colanic/teichoic acid biosynthesis glycosyltransferase
MMGPAELCVPERPTAVAVAHRKTLPKHTQDGPVGLLHVADGNRLRQSAREVEERESTDSTLRRLYVPLKVVAEWVIALTLCLLTLPLVAALACLVKLSSPGPALYLQTRLGRGGRLYKICKLRTMVHNCEATTGPVWAAKDDDRITGLGRVLRMTHLDELPQLWNVLKGEMSLIGPRPERPEIVSRIERELPHYRKRLELRPGVTGLAQMRLPADTDIEGVRRKLAHDLYYIREISPLMDLRIAVCTVFYFAGTAAEAVCDAAVGPYARELKRELVRPADAGREMRPESARSPSRDSTESIDRPVMLLAD